MPELHIKLNAHESAPHIILLLQQDPETKQFYPTIKYCIDKDLPTEMILGLSHILLPFEKPAVYRKERTTPSAARYYAVVEDVLLGQGSYGSVRPIIGVWKIEHEQALFKIKPAVEKTRLLKTLFFSPAIAKTMHEAGSTPDKTAQSHEIYEEKIKNRFKKDLSKEQIIGSYTPHLSTKYPIIETDEGVHLLMRKQPGVDLEHFIIWLQKKHHNVSVIQRLLLCIELYETLEREVHSITTSNKGRLIHRDIKPANIILSMDGHIFKTHIIDYGMCTDDTNQVHELCGTPIYLDPEVFHANSSPSAINDLFALAVICAQLWGDTKRRTIPTEQFCNENKNIQFQGLWENFDCSAKLKENLLPVLTATTRCNPANRLTKEQIIENYKQILLDEYTAITSTSPILSKRISDLNAQLDDYDQPATRIWLDKEFLAADYLAQHPNLTLVNESNADKSLHDIWNNYYWNLMDRVHQKQFPKDTPYNLLVHIDSVKRYCNECFLPLNPPKMIYLERVWLAITNLSALFQRVKFLTPNPSSISSIFDQTLYYAESVQQTAVSTIMEEVRKHLSAFLESSLPKDSICKDRFYSLCQNAVDPNSMADSTLLSEWSMAIRLLNLSDILIERESFNIGDLIKALNTENSFANAFGSLYDAYKKNIKNQLTEVLAIQEQLSTNSPHFFEKTVSHTPINVLIAQIDTIFLENKSQPETIQTKIYNVTLSALKDLRKNLTTASLSAQQETLVSSLSVFEENMKTKEVSCKNTPHL